MCRLLLVFFFLIILIFCYLCMLKHSPARVCQVISLYDDEHTGTSNTLCPFAPGQGAVCSSGKRSEPRFSRRSAGLQCPHAVQCAGHPLRRHHALCASGCRRGRLFLSRPVPGDGPAAGALLSLQLQACHQVCPERRRQRNSAHRGPVAAEPAGRHPVRTLLHRFPSRGPGRDGGDAQEP